MQYETKTQLRVGMFVIGALAVGGALVFAIGNRAHLLESKLRYHMSFESVGGLTVGSPVRVAGVQVGDTEKVEISKVGKIMVTVEVITDAQHLLREGSIASLGSKGLLGDRVVDISVGKGAELKEGAWIPTKEPLELSSYVQKADSLIADATGTAHNLKEATEPFADRQFSEDLKRSTAQLAKILEATAQSKGLVGRLFNDPQLANETVATITSLKSLSAELNASAKNLHDITDQVRTGPGMVHSLVYNNQASKLPEELARLSGSLAALLQKIMSSKSAAHELLVGDDSGKMLAELEKTAANLNAITGDIRQGKGSLGALIQDPSVYEDVKRLVGNLERNEILRALVRYSIRNDEKPAKAKIKSTKN